MMMSRSRNNSQSDTARSKGDPVVNNSDDLVEYHKGSMLAKSTIAAQVVIKMLHKLLLHFVAAHLKTRSGSSTP